MISRPYRRYADRRLADDRGGISVFAAIISVPLLLVGGILAVDSFGVTRAHEKADGAATEAARAGAQALDLSQVIPGKAIAVDPAAAAAAARAYLARVGVDGTVTVTGGGRRINVHVSATYSGVFALASWTVHASSSATLLHGITTPDKD
ncbi:pilus assembly protein TadG-related protein [Streptomyces sp. NPDC001904]|uniref:pilus assembly protein TadG-related protein n=1 Tax=Streptomyces sp. NPDC001904 TaxID=3154531 RepID=UPI00333379C2